MVRSGKLEDLIGLLVREGGSDLHLKVGSPPVTRVQGLLTPVEGYGVLDLPETEAFLEEIIPEPLVEEFERVGEDRKSTRLNSSHSQISYAVFCLKKKKK